MNPPGPIKGDRQLPDGAISRRQISETLYQHLADIRRREGVDPARYPAVDYDLQYDTRRTLYGAEVVARETADLMLPALLAGGNPARRHWLPRLLRHPLLAAGAIVVAGYAGLRDLGTTAARQQQALLTTQATQADSLHAIQAAQAEGAKLAEAQRCQLESLNRLLAANACRVAFQEAIGHALNANSPQVKTSIGPEVVTLRIQDTLTRKDQGVRIIEMRHGLTPDEFENLRKTVDAAKTISIAK
jgi:hypothetical protein